MSTIDVVSSERVDIGFEPQVDSVENASPYSAVTASR